MMEQNMKDIGKMIREMDKVHYIIKKVKENMKENGKTMKEMGEVPNSMKNVNIMKVTGKTEKKMDRELNTEMIAKEKVNIIKVVRKMDFVTDTGHYIIMMIVNGIL